MTPVEFEKIKRHLACLPPHVKDRETARMLGECVEVITKYSKALESFMLTMSKKVAEIHDCAKQDDSKGVLRVLKELEEELEKDN